jgi:hypothetical protein
MMPCPLDPEILVFVLEPEGGLEQRFAASHAFSVYGRGVAGPFIVVDARLRRQPWFTEDHMLALIAHELAHILRHSPDELQADLLALRLLLEAGHLGAYALLRDEHERRLANDWYERHMAA